ncbi:MAG: SRPBCC domain-containing protein [bacterium]
MATQQANAPERVVEKDLLLVRTFQVPRARVYKAWTDPTLLAQWWGPRGFTNPVVELDPQHGGAIRIDMTGPDGTLYPMAGTFTEIDPPERLVFTATAIDDGDGIPQLATLNDISFAEHDGLIRLTVHVTVIKATAAAIPAIEGMDQGWNESLDRLGELLASQ